MSAESLRARLARYESAMADPVNHRMESLLALDEVRRYDSYDVAEAWGFTPAKPIIWCKAPKAPYVGGPFGGASVEFCLFACRGSLKPKSLAGRQWWEWPRGAHSAKPGGFMDIVEQVSPGPYVELFARQPRLGWDAWGYGVEAA